MMTTEEPSNPLESEFANESEDPPIIGTYTSSTDVLFRTCMSLLLVVFGAYLFLSPDPANGPLGAPATALSMIDAIIHEIGHSLFSLFGQTIMILGAAFAQIVFPGLLAIRALATRSRTFWLLLYWLGENVLSIGKYISDARSRSLELFVPFDAFSSPEELKAHHDWHTLLSQWNLLENDHLIGAVVQGLGAMIMLLSIAGLATAFEIWLRFKLMGTRR